MKKETENMLENEFNTYQTKVTNIAETVFNNEIKPFLIKRKWKLIIGMGTHWIGPINGKCQYIENRPNDKAFKKINDLLSIEVPGFRSNDLCDFMPEYNCN